MLQKNYSIYSEDLSDVQLLIEAGKNHIACWCRSNNNGKLKAFEFFQSGNYKAGDFERLIDNVRLHSRLLTMPVSKTYFFWNTNESLCLPGSINNESFLQSNFQLLFGDADDKKIQSLAINGYLVAWRMEENLQQIASENFRGASFTHQYVPLLGAALSDKTDGLHIFFYPFYFTLFAFRDGKLLFAQTKKYNTPEDVLYHILNTCEQYNIEKNTQVYCGGFIDAQSKLYETLYQYLEGMQLVIVDKNRFGSKVFNDYAPHYFAPYINYDV
ncbi:MAG: DUF3822 family protein [Bacteroidetes bacterium]|nr:DUF3822 family protein [Bacteroidota bacterium]